MSSIGPSLDTHCVESVFVDGAMDLREIYDAHGSLVYSSSIRAAALVAAWLVGITKRRIIDHVRAQRRHIVHRADEDVNAAGSYTARFDRACCEFATTWSPPMTDDATPRHRQ